MRWEVIVAGQKTKRLKKSNDTIITRTSPPLGGLGGKIEENEPPCRGVGGQK